jgi:hypothetical protein
MRRLAILGVAWPAALGLTLSAVAQSPAATIHSAQLTATIALPDAQTGYYRGTRFDWSGVISSLTYKGHQFITPWSQINDPAVADYEYRDDQIATGTNSTIVGMPEEFLSMPARTAPGWEEAAVGATFVKIGVGVLRKPDDKPYDHFRLYERVPGGTWEVHRSSSSVTFRQSVMDPGSGYGYIYTKKITLLPGKAALTIAHTLHNTGSRSLQGMVYDHNFIRWDNETPGPDYSLQFIFEPKPFESLGEMPLFFSGHTVAFTRALAGKESVRALPVGFGNTAADYDFRIQNTKLGIGMRITADQPLVRAAIWGMRSVFAIEPFVGYDIQPGADYSWTYSYQLYELSAN